jgi:hypothetical protein
LAASSSVSDYVVIDGDGVFEMGSRLNNSLLMHEIGHCCNLCHCWNGVTNLM